MPAAILARPAAPSAMRGAGDAATPFKFQILTVALDVALNPLLIFGLGPVPALGIAGSLGAGLMGAGIYIMRSMINFAI